MLLCLVAPKSKTSTICVLRSVTSSEVRFSLVFFCVYSSFPLSDSLLCDLDIQAFDAAYAREVLVEAMPSGNGASEYSLLVTRKFKRLEQFVLCLKKRIQRLESMEAGLGEVAAKFGSVTKLVDDNKRLEKVCYP